MTLSRKTIWILVALIACCHRPPPDPGPNPSPSGSEQPSPTAPQNEQRPIDRSDLARWATQNQGLGMECLDEKIRFALVRTANQQPFERNRVVVNPRPEMVENDPTLLPIYWIEASEEAPQLQWLKGTAQTVRIDMIHGKIPIIVVDRNLIRWMGAKTERLIKSTVQFMRDAQRAHESRGSIDTTIDNLANGIVDPQFGRPLKHSDPPDALRNYCKPPPAPQDLVIVWLTWEATLWTLRHEMHHAWHPIPNYDRTRCPSMAEVAKASKPEIEADRFAIDQANAVDIDDIVAPWKSTIARWTDCFPGSLEKETRLSQIAQMVAHHEAGTIKASQAWIARGRSRNLAQLLDEDHLDPTGALDSIVAAQRCPNENQIDTKCDRCPTDEKECQEAIELAWNCFGVLAETTDLTEIRRQEKILEMILDELHHQRFQTSRRPESTQALVAYLVERQDTHPVNIIFLRGKKMTPETEDKGSIVLERMFERGESIRVINGFAVLKEKSKLSNLSTRPVLDLLFSVETKQFKKECLSGSAEACRWLGMAYWEGRGTKMDVKYAYEFYEKSCQMHFKKGCDQKEKLRQILHDSCEAGEGLLCREWRRIFRDPPPRPTKKHCPPLLKPPSGFEERRCNTRRQ